MKQITEHKGIFKRTYTWYPDKLFDVKSDYIKFISYKRLYTFEGFNPDIFPELMEFEEKRKKTLLIDLNDSEEIIFNNFSNSCKRAIKKAQKEELYVENSIEYNPFYKIYNKYMKKFKITPWSLDFIKQGDLFLVKRGNEIISGSIILSDGNYSSQIIQATSEKIRGTNNLLMWETIKHYKKLGCKIFDLGGIELDSEKETGVDKFKKSFGGYEADVWHYEKTNSILYKSLKSIVEVFKK